MDNFIEKAVYLSPESEIMFLGFSALCSESSYTDELPSGGTEGVEFNDW